MEEQEEKKMIRRAPAIPVRISKLNNVHSRVCIAGTIVSKNKDIGSIVLDDGTAQILVLANVVTDFDSLETGKFVRAFGKMVGEGEEKELMADFVQDFSKIDKDLYLQICA